VIVVVVEDDRLQDRQISVVVAAVVFRVMLDARDVSQ
jgi:hypothetical protein